MISRTRISFSLSVFLASITIARWSPAQQAAAPPTFEPPTPSLVESLEIVNTLQRERTALPAAPQVPDQWRKDLLKWPEAFWLMYANSTWGARGAEFRHFEAMSGSNLQSLERSTSPTSNPRIAALELALEKFPRSPYADDTALLRARAEYLHRGDAAGAIRRLQQVAVECPQGEWIAEVPVIVEDLPGRVRNFISYSATYVPMGDEPSLVTPSGGSGLRRLEQTAPATIYAFQHASHTSDMALVFAGWIILNAKLEPRYGEAEALFRAMIDKHRPARRSAEDALAEFELKSFYHSLTQRPEREAGQWLVALLLIQGKRAEALAAAEDYAQLHAGHSSVAGVQRLVQPQP